MKPIDRLMLCALSLITFIPHLVLAGDVPATRPSTQPAGKVLRVAVYRDTGGTDKDNVGKCLSRSGDFTYTLVTAQDIRAGKLKDFDVLVQPGGSGSKQAETLQPEGREIIKKFVQDGGGYVGICGGAYLATTHYKWSIGLLNAQVVDTKHWARGTGTVQLRLTSDGKSLAGVKDEIVPVDYAQGPLLAPDNKPDLPAYQPLATFETEIAKNGAPVGVMKGTTAAAQANFGKGRVICISPHPERSAGLDGLIRNAVRWVANAPTPTEKP
ncbi:BPL-N domain-containing protein [Humisphaera borealis]|uniref:Biofilm PGA synthesis protein PgaC n=1 Tax=Humisphaera borealis TaxID=2807512 RepID=A0A7M2WY47_9BACT|nr:BPL-N domain-containing protein [Humisphaera borealis]QOV90396.1 biofilm PGA synthesis protein PgaC [Humisphaera borealis]